MAAFPDALKAGGNGNLILICNLELGQVLMMTSPVTLTASPPPPLGSAGSLPNEFHPQMTVTCSRSVRPEPIRRGPGLSLKRSRAGLEGVDAPEGRKGSTTPAALAVGEMALSGRSASHASARLRSLSCRNSALCNIQSLDTLCMETYDGTYLCYVPSQICVKTRKIGSTTPAALAFEGMALSGRSTRQASAYFGHCHAAPFAECRTRQGCSLKQIFSMKIHKPHGCHEKGECRCPTCRGHEHVVSLPSAACQHVHESMRLKGVGSSKRKFAYRVDIHIMQGQHPLHFGNDFLQDGRLHFSCH